MAKQTISEQTQKLLFMLYRKLRNIRLPVDLQLKLFDTLILPAQLYNMDVRYGDLVTIMFLKKHNYNFVNIF